MNENLNEGLLRGNPANFQARHYTQGLWITFLSSPAITAFCRLESPFVAKKTNFEFFILVFCLLSPEISSVFENSIEKEAATEIRKLLIKSRRLERMFKNKNNSVCNK